MKIKKTFQITKIRRIFWFLTCFTSVAWGQDYNFDIKWNDVGPSTNPVSRSVSEGGIGPVEFIRISKKNPDLMLAGSLNGGLFVSENGGDLWKNAGSDNWNVSNCGWAEIYPSDDNIWFAVSMRDGFGADPGNISKNGGVFRTKNRGITWESVGDYSDFNNSTSLIIYGLRFWSDNSKKMYALTNKGLYFTEDCTADYLEWSKVSYVDGLIYDLEVEKDFLCFSNKVKKRWNVMISEGQRLIPIPEIASESRPINRITVEKLNGLFYFLIDFEKVKDEVWTYNPKTKKIEVVYNRGIVTFGSGYTFGINPHNPNELMIGNRLRLVKWLIDEQTTSRIGTDYHVDLECVAYHPSKPNIVFIGSHGGVFKSSDNGASWEFKSEGMGIAEVLGLSVSKNDPKTIAVGLFHDGSLVHADWDKNGAYYWKQVNGGDALIPIINPQSDSIIYTSNQYGGGGLYYSEDTAKRNKRLHSSRQFKTSGWSMAAALHPNADSILFFNFSDATGKGNIDVLRSKRPHDPKSFEVISDFNASHGLKKYQVYRLFTSKFHPDLLFAYVLSTEQSKGKEKRFHRLFMLSNSLDSTANIKNQWQELDIPRNDWVGDLELHPKKWHKMYLSYSAGVPVKSSAPDDKGMVYHLKYKKSDYTLQRNWDISGLIPSATGGMNNMVMTKGKELFIGTSTGVYFGTKSTLKGGKSWQFVGDNLPNCSVTGLDYNVAYRILTISYDGRGVWQANL